MTGRETGRQAGVPNFPEEKNKEKNGTKITTECAGEGKNHVIITSIVTALFGGEDRLFLPPSLQMVLAFLLS